MMAGLWQRLMRGELGRGFTFTFIAVGISAASTFAQAFILSSYLGLSLFGMVAFVQAMAIIVSALCNPNSFQPLIIHLSGDTNDKLTVKQAGLVRACSRLDMRLGVLASLLFIVLAWLMIEQNWLAWGMSAQDMFWMFLLYMPITLLLILQNSALGYFRFVGRFDFLAKTKTCFALLTLILVVLLAWMGGEVSTQTAYIALLATVIGRGGEFLWLYIAMHRALPKVEKVPTLSELCVDQPKLKSGLWASYVQNLSLNILEMADVFLAGIFFGSKEAGIIRLIRTVMGALSLPVIALRQVLLPIVSAKVQEGALEQLRNLIRRFSAAVLTGISAFVIATAWLDEQIGRMFEHVYGAVLPGFLLPLFIAGCGFYYISSVITTVVVSRHKNGQLMWALSLLTLCYAGLCVIGAVPLQLYVFAVGYVAFYVMLSVVSWRFAWSS